MKIAIATEGSQVALHFGRCPEYSLYDIEDGLVKEKTVVPNPGHAPDVLPKYLSELGVICIITGGMGVRAQNLFESKKVKTIVGATGNVDDVAKAFANGTLKGGESLCERGQGKHDKDHDCKHHDHSDK